MCMLTHRLQILLDQERYERVTEIARQRRVSVATVVREALDRGLPAPSHRREAAFARIRHADPMPVPDEPADLKREIHEERLGRFE